MLRDEGYFATRTAGSHGIADIWATKQGILMLIQIKSTKNYLKYATPTIRKVKKEFDSLNIESVPGWKVSKQLWIFHDRRYNIIFMN